MPLTQSQSLEQSPEVAFVILTYRNHADLADCLTSIERKVGKAKSSTFVIDSFYDEQTSRSIQETALSRGAFYTKVENRGYGAGNNVGVAESRERMNPDFYIICNPDTVIETFPDGVLSLIAQELGNPRDNAYIIAPDIRNLKGKHQNPLVVRQDEAYARGIYRGFRDDKPLQRAVYFAVNRLRRIAFLITCSRDTLSRVYAAHGSFIIFSSKAVEDLSPIFDEHIFLFAEELLLAWDAESRDIGTYYCPAIRIKHKEDGSVSLLSGTNAIATKSNVYVYKKTHGLMQDADSQGGHRNDV